VKILVYDKYKHGFKTDYIKETGLDEIYERADIVSLHVPLNEETTYMVNKSFLKRF